MRRTALALAVLALAPAGAQAARWDTSVFALVPRPGFPAMAYAAPNGRVYEGTYDNPSGDAMASRVLEYDAAGAQMRSWTIAGQDLSAAHGVQVATMDAQKRLILLDKAPPRVLRINLVTGRQTTVAPFPDGAVPNYGAWGPDGALYVTDYEGATIWRVAAGEAKPWLKTTELDGGPFGTTGIVLSEDRRSFLVGQQSESGLGAGNPTTGRIWRVPIQPDGAPGPLAQVWESLPADGPDGFAVARSGAIYVACLVANQIAVVNPDGSERERFPSTPFGSNGSPVPFDSPSSARFLGSDLVVANQSYFQGDPAHQAILRVATGEQGLPEYIPPKPKPKPKPKRKRRRR